jgi:sulfate/thiosulfate transport system permease protein
VLPGFGLTLGFTLTYLSLIVLIPLAALVARSMALSWSEFVAAVNTPRTIAAFRLSLFASLIGASINAVLGFVVAWTLVRYTFPGKRFVDACVDLPFALPTAVSGIALTALYAPTGWIGRWLAPLGIEAVYTPLGVVIALTFIGVPFVVRTLQPALEDLEPELEEAAATLGASRYATLRRVVVPAVLPALLTGFALAFARAIGEYGSVIFISGGRIGRTEIPPMLIVEKLDQFQYAEATAIAVVLLVISLVLLVCINGLGWWVGRHQRIPH